MQLLDPHAIMYLANYLKLQLGAIAEALTVIESHDIGYGTAAVLAKNSTLITSSSQIIHHVKVIVMTHYLQIHPMQLFNFTYIQ